MQSVTEGAWIDTQLYAHINAHYVTEKDFSNAGLA